jgi:hypothetical protein
MSKAIVCPKCKNECYDENLSIENNPNLITCDECQNVFFVEVVFKIHKAYENEGSYYTKPQLRNL